MRHSLGSLMKLSTAHCQWCVDYECANACGGDGERNSESLTHVFAELFLLLFEVEVLVLASVLLDCLVLVRV